MKPRFRPFSSQLNRIGDPPALPGRPEQFDVSGSPPRLSFREPPRARKVKSRWTSSRSSSHTKWDCKYHIVFIPKYRRKVLYGQLRAHLGEIFRNLAAQKESRIEEGHLMVDHVHMMISIPPNMRFHR